ncbi:MAG TPA: sialidase family protein [Candidatus Acidoferrales bacterium]
MKRIFAFALFAMLVASPLILMEQPVHADRRVPRIGPIQQVTDDPFGDNEISIAINPLNPKNILVAFNDFSPANSVGWAFTLDGGKTWTVNEALPNLTTPTGGEWDFAADPSVDFDRFGNAYIGVLAYDATGQGASGGVFVYRSRDFGRTVEGPFTVIRGVRLNRVHDHPLMKVDNSGGINDGQLYTAWSQFFGWGLKAISVFSKCVDPAATGAMVFTPPVVISDRHDAEIFDVSATGARDGSIYATFGGWKNPSIWNEQIIYVARSDDGGASFQPTVKVADIVPAPKFLPNSGWRSTEQPSVAVDNNTGRVYVAYGNYASGDNDIYCQFSDDNGQTWSLPVRVNNDAFGNGKDQVFGWMTVAPNGRVDVVFYDRRDDPNNTLLHIYYAFSTDGGLSFTNVRVTDTPIDGNAQVPAGLSRPFLGDYIGIVSTEKTVRLGWTGNGTSNLAVFSAAVEY